MSDQQAAKPGGSKLHRNPWVTALLILGGRHPAFAGPVLADLFRHIDKKRARVPCGRLRFGGPVDHACRFCDGAAGVGVIVFAIRR
jgi:hypothetical protein